MLSTVVQGVAAAAKRVAEEFPQHKPFQNLHAAVQALDESELREKMDEYLLPIAPKLQKKDIEYFKADPTFASLDLGNVDLTGKDELVDEVFTLLNHTILLNSTVSLLPANLLDVAQSMASQMAGAVGPNGEVDQGAMQGILGQAMEAAGLHRPASDPETAQAKLAKARKNLI